MLKRDVFGFWNQPERNTDKHDVQRSIQPERAGGANAIEQRQERCANDHVRHPVGGGRAGDTEVAAFQRLDLGAEDPHHRRRAHRIPGNTHHGHADGEPGEAAGCGAIVELHQAVAQHQSAQRHHAKADFQRRFAPGLIDGKDGDKGGEHKGNTSGDNSAGGSGPGHGGGSGGGNGTGDGTGNGDGQGQGNGKGDGTGKGDGHGTVKADFDTEGFRARVQDNAQMPSMALKRKLQGDVTVQVTLDTNGSLIGQSIIYSTNEIFNDAAMSAVVAATPYKNPTGEDIDIKIPVEFRGHESSDDEEE